MCFSDIKLLVFKTLQYVNKVGYKKISTKVEIFKVGTTGFEPATTRPPDVCATGLRYVPNKLFILFPRGVSCLGRDYIPIKGLQK